jgi:hypothetical protein
MSLRFEKFKVELYVKKACKDNFEWYNGQNTKVRSSKLNYYIPSYISFKHAGGNFTSLRLMYCSYYVVEIFPDGTHEWIKCRNLHPRDIELTTTEKVLFSPKGATDG